MIHARILAAAAALFASSLSIPAWAQSNVITNPGFESGPTGWGQTSSMGFPVVSNRSGIARSGAWFGWLGGGVNITDSLYQDVTIPAGAVLDFWYKSETNAEFYGDFGDEMVIELVDPATGALIGEIDDFFWGDNSGGWRRSLSYDLSDYAGRRARLRFRSTNNGTDLSNWFIDDVALTGTAPASNYTALWWNPAESGWGINVTQQGNIAFATLFTYDSNGAPLWLVMSQGNRQGSTETFAGELYRTTGPVFNAVPFTPIGPSNLSRVGTMTLSFSGPSAGTLTYSYDGTTVAKSIQKQVYGTRAATCTGTSGSRASATNYQDLWWNSAESGWGLNLAHQDNTLFATLFTYGANNQGVWLVMSGGTRQADGSYLGTLYRMSGPVFNAQPFAGAAPTPVGSMRLRFQNGEAGTLEYTYNSSSVTKSITRQNFSSPVSVCAS